MSDADMPCRQSGNPPSNPYKQEPVWDLAVTEWPDGSCAQQAAAFGARRWSWPNSAYNAHRVLGRYSPLDRGISRRKQREAHNGNN